MGTHLNIESIFAADMSPLKSIGFLFLAFIFLYVPVNSQTLNKGFDQLSLYNYHTAKVIFEKNLNRHPVSALYGLSLLYSGPGPYHNIDSAFIQIARADSFFSTYNEKQKKKLSKKYIDSQSIATLKHQIDSLTFKEYKDQNQLESINFFISNYSGSNYYQLAIQERNRLAFAEAQRINTLASYKRFINDFPQANERIEAINIFNRLQFSMLVREHSIESYENFIIKNPNSPFSRQAQDSLFMLFVKDNETISYIRFIDKYPSNPNVSKAWDTIYYRHCYDLDFHSFKEFILRFPEYPDLQEIKQELILSTETYLPIHDSTKWGFINQKGEQRILPMFEWVSEFSEGLASVGLNGQVVYIKKNGQIQIPFLEAESSSFNTGYAIVFTATDKQGLINKQGTLVLDTVYDDIGEFSNGRLVVAKNDRYFYLDKNLHKAFDHDFDNAYDFEKDYAIVQSQGKYGYINNEGTYFIQPVFDYASKFVNDLAIVKSGDLFGLINRNGDTIVDFIYDNIKIYENKIIALVKDDKIGYADLQGKIVIPIEYDYSESLFQIIPDDTELIIARKQDKWGVLNYQNKLVIPFKYKQLRYLEKGLFLARLTHWGIINEENKTILSFKLHDPGLYADSILIVHSNEKQKLLNVFTLIESEQIFDKIYPVQNGFLIVQVEEKFGLIDKEGNIVLQPVFSKIQWINNQIIKVYQHDKFAYWSISRHAYIWKEKGFGL